MTWAINRFLMNDTLQRTLVEKDAQRSMSHCAIDYTQAESERDTSSRREECAGKSQRSFRLLLEHTLRTGLLPPNPRPFPVQLLYPSVHCILDARVEALSLSLSLMITECWDERWGHESTRDRKAKRDLHNSSHSYVHAKKRERSDSIAFLTSYFHWPPRVHLYNLTSQANAAHKRSFPFTLALSLSLSLALCPHTDSPAAAPTGTTMMDIMFSFNEERLEATSPLSCWLYE